MRLISTILLSGVVALGAAGGVMAQDTTAQPSGPPAMPVPARALQVALGSRFGGARANGVAQTAAESRLRRGRQRIGKGFRDIDAGQ